MFGATEWLRPRKTWACNLSSSTRGACVRAQQKESVSEEHRTAQADLARLKREVARLSEENDFLEKVAAHFAKGSK